MNDEIQGEEAIQDGASTKVSNLREKAKKYTQALKGNPEAKACAYGSAAQGVIVGAGVLMAIPLLKLAEASVCGEPLPDECTKRVYGFRPSSLLTLMSTISGFLACVILPTVGGMVDATPYRRGIALMTGIILVIEHFVLIIVSRNTWFFCSLLLTISSIFYFTHVTLIYAYIPELTDNEEDLTTYNSIFVLVRSFIVIPYYIITGLAFYLVVGLDGIGTLDFEQNIARVSTCVESIFLIFLYFMTFYKGLEARPPKQKAAESPLKSILKIKETASEIYTRYPALYWYLVTLLPYSNSVASMASISVTFVTSFLKAETWLIGLMAIMFGVCNIIGSRVHPFIAKRINLLNDIKLNMVLWIVLCITSGLTVTGPERMNLFLVFACLFGFIFGWAIPSMRTVYFCLMPKGRESQFAGIYMFFSTGLIWLPPLLFTILNEAGLRMNYILLLLFVPFVISLLLLTKVGSFEDAVANVKKQEQMDEEMEEKRLAEMQEQGINGDGIHEDNGPVHEDSLESKTE